MILTKGFRFCSEHDRELNIGATENFLFALWWWCVVMCALFHTGRALSFNGLGRVLPMYLYMHVCVCVWRRVCSVFLFVLRAFPFCKPPDVVVCSFGIRRSSQVWERSSTTVWTQIKPCHVLLHEICVHTYLGGVIQSVHCSFSTLLGCRGLSENYRLLHVLNTAYVINKCNRKAMENKNTMRGQKVKPQFCNHNNLSLQCKWLVDK